MAGKTFSYYNLERYYFGPNGVTTADDVKRERYITLLVIVVLVVLAVGLPAFITLGKTLFEIQPIIY